MEENMSISTDLLTSINDAMYVSANNAATYMHNGRGADAMCILNEWTTVDGECVLTNFIKGEISESEETFTFINMRDEIWGEFMIMDDD
jgi:hypothetical protein